MKNIHIIPTDKPSRLYKTGDFLLLDSKAMPNNTLETKNQHIYITSNEEIKDGWSYDRMMKSIGKRNNVYSSKIILTTDQDLINDGVQAIDDEFLEWFVKNPSCEEVEVSYDKDAFPYGVKTAKGYGWYKTIIPKEEPEQTDEKGRPMTYWGGLEEPSMVDKLKDYFNNTTEEQIQKDWDKTCEQTKGINSPTVAEFLEAQKQFGKQETLEEAAENFVNNTRLRNYKVLFIEGAKWQAERMYSEEEVESLLHKFMQHRHPDWHGWSTTKWFKQFKKK